MCEEDKIRFSDLTWPLKTAVVASWVMGIIWVLAFVVGFIQGLLLY